MEAIRRVVSALIWLLLPLTAEAEPQATEPRQACPDKPLSDVLAQHKPPPLKVGQPAFDRKIFWQRIEEISRKGEVFRFASKRNGEDGKAKSVDKEVVLHRSVVAPERRAAVNAIIDRWEATGGGHPKHLALILGTAYRETCGLLSSGVGEACGCKTTCAVDELGAAGYGRKDQCGRAFFGRGFVQITNKGTYESVGKRLGGVPLADYPDLAYEPALATILLVDGVKNRWYAGKPLRNYLDDSLSNWVEARESVNPHSRNKVATGYLACRFYDALQPAYLGKAPTQDPQLCIGLKNL